MLQLKGTKKLVFMSLLTAIALTVFVIEAQLPSPVPVPGVKLGLANIVTLTAMLLLGRREAGTILLLRILLSTLFSPSVSTFLFSAAGGTLAYLTMCLLIRAFPERLCWVVSAFAAVAHNAGQLLMCVVWVKTPGVLLYAPILAASGVITGVFTGFGALYLTRALRKLKL